MQTRSFHLTPDRRSPAGAEIRYLIEGETGNMIHSTVPPGQVNRATVHATVSEFWHVLSGEGQIWRRDGTGDETTVLGRGVFVVATVGDGDAVVEVVDREVPDLVLVDIRMPPTYTDEGARAAR